MKKFDIEFSDIKYSKVAGIKRVRKEILHGLNGRFAAGKLIGIMGPSGCGKTTLLNVLSGFTTADYTGEIRINGVPRDRTTIQRYTCYVMQDNYLQELLTVRENFEFVYNLNKKAYRTTDGGASIVQDIIQNLMLDHLQTRQVRFLSGGEKKRVSIGLELVKSPSVIFLDEPTTGLDTGFTRFCINYLKKLSQEGRTIICTIHQPSAPIFLNFDEAYVMRAGRCLYQGETAHLLSALELANLPCPMYYNPADFIVELANGDYGDEATEVLLETYESPSEVRTMNNNKTNSDDEKTTIEEEEVVKNKKIKKPNQFGLLIKREAVKLQRSPSLLKLRMIMSVVNSLFIGLLFYDAGCDAMKTRINYHGLIGFVAHILISSYLLMVVTFPSEMLVLRKEYFNGWYSLKSYYASKMIVELPVAFVYVSISMTIFYYLTGQILEWQRFGMFYVVTFLFYQAGAALGLAIGAGLDITKGITVASGISFPMILFSGFAITPKDIPSSIRWLSNFSHMNYFVEGMVGAVYGYNRPKLVCPDDEFCEYTDPQRFINDMGINGNRFATDVYRLCIFNVVFQLLAFFILYRRIK